MSELISVIMPVYNVAPYLEKAVKSVLAQTHRHFELILVDDGSTDTSGALCDQLATLDDRIQVIHQANAGVSVARNHGLEASIGDYLLFLDPDDYVEADMLSQLYQQLIAENADVSSCNILNVYEDKQSAQFDDADFYQVMDTSDFLQAYLIGQTVPGSLCIKLLRRSVVANLRFLPGKTYEDAFYHFDLMQVAKRYVVTGKPLYYYYHRSDSLTTKPFNERAMDCVEVYTLFYQWVTKHRPQFESEAFFRLAHAYFTAFDRLMLLPDYQANPYYAELLRFLRAHSFQIARNPHFRMGRRLASVVLKFSVQGYRRLLFKDLKTNKGINQHDQRNQTDNSTSQTN